MTNLTNAAASARKFFAACRDESTNGLTYDGQPVEDFLESIALGWALIHRDPSDENSEATLLDLYSESDYRLALSKTSTDGSEGIIRTALLLSH